jgi:hypothetical protein
MGTCLARRVGFTDVTAGKLRDVGKRRIDL